jgi:hypothetical protein
MFPRTRMGLQVGRVALPVLDRRDCHPLRQTTFPAIRRWEVWDRADRGKQMPEQYSVVHDTWGDDEHE